MGKSRAKSTTVDVFEHGSARAYLHGVVAARQAQRPTYSLSAFARSSKIRYGRLRSALRGALDLEPDEILSLSAHLRHNTDEAAFFAQLVAFDQAKSVEERRRSLEALVQVLEQRAERAGRGAHFRAHHRWEHRAAWLGLRAGAMARKAETVAHRVGVSLEAAAQILADLDALGSKLTLAETVTADATTDLPTLLLVDDLVLLGMRSLARRPDAGQNSVAHWALPLRSAAEHSGVLEPVHADASGSEPPSPGSTPRLVLLMTHTTRATAVLEP